MKVDPFPKFEVYVDGREVFHEDPDCDAIDYVPLILYWDEAVDSGREPCPQCCDSFDEL